MCFPVYLKFGEKVRSIYQCGKWKMNLLAWWFHQIAEKLGKIRGAASVPDNDHSYDEYIIVVRKDVSLWMLARIKYGIGESVSFDKWHSWSSLIPSRIPVAKFFEYRLHSGNLNILVTSFTEDDIKISLTISCWKFITTAKLSGMEAKDNIQIKN